jgi:pimeloyl-ACP methyl ester carboxylesterase
MPNLTAGDVRAISQLIILATQGVTNVTQEAHANLVVPPGTPKPIAQVVRPIAMAVPDLVYSIVKGIANVVGDGLDAALALVPSEVVFVRSEAPVSETREVALAVLNGVVGHTLVEKGNALSIPMTLRRGGIPIEPSTLGESLPHGGKSLLILIHGSCMNDLHWRQGAFEYGQTLAAVLQSDSLYLHYNTGLRISSNGAALSALLESLVGTHPAVERISFVTHSMGGLVLRSACAAAQREGHTWIQRVRYGVFLGTPHHGAPLERLGTLVDMGLGALTATKAFASLGKIRSHGVNDLADGSISNEDWAEGRKPRAWVPLPAHIRWFAAAAMLGKREHDVGAELLGDGLVPLHSALGNTAKQEESLALLPEQTWIGYGMNHIDLLRNEPLLEQLKLWLSD